MNTLNAVELSIYNTAVGSAMAAGALIKKQFLDRAKIEREYAHDLKLEIDRLAEKTIIDIIEDTFYDHSIISEEIGIKVKSGEYCWIIDPLDGTVNYFYGIPYFCTCVACYKTDSSKVKNLLDGKKMQNPGEPVAGVVYVPSTGELYSAFRGKGAFRNGVKINASNKTKLSEVIVVMSTGSSPDVISDSLKAAEQFALKARKVRMFGATGLDILNVASGAAGVFFQRASNLWDFAASRVILEEAGGDFYLNEVEPGKWDIIANDPGISDELESVLGSFIRRV